MQLRSIFFQSCLVCSFLCASILPVYADSVQLNTGNIRIKSKQIALPSPSPTIQQFPNPIIDSNGIPNNFTLGQANISLSSDLLSFADMSPTSPQLRKATLEITTDEDQLTQLLLYTDGPLDNASGSASIPPTTCDNGTCTLMHADSWTNTLTYGLGYNDDPKNLTYFSQLPTLPQAYKQLDQIQNMTKIFNFTYKINISASQANDTYSNNVTYLLLPQL